jgi:hypothetical protein
MSRTGPLVLIETGVAGAEDGAALDITELMRLIDTVDRLEAVVPAGDGTFTIDGEALAILNPIQQKLVTAAVARANCDPLLQSDEGIAGAEGEPEKKPSLPEEIGRFAKIFTDSAVAVTKNVQTILEGSTATVKWWGVEVDMTEDAAKALAASVSQQIGPVLCAVGVLHPAASPTLMVVLAAGGALAGWINTANSKNGVRIGLYLWLVPWVIPKK